MPRIEIELTGTRPDGGWTWRAAGARQPKGVIRPGIVPDGCKVGDVMRAETAANIDGINISSVVAPKAKREVANRLEITGSGDPRFDTDPHRPRRGVAANPGYGRPPAGPPSNERRERPERRPGGPSGPANRDRAPAGRFRPSEGSDRSPGSPGGQRRPSRAARPERPSGSRDPAGAKPSSSKPIGSGSRRPRSERPVVAPPIPKPRAKRLAPGRERRDAVFATLDPVQRQLAKQVLRGGLPAVRSAVEEQNQAARAAGAPEIAADALLAMSEDLLPVLQAADWQDRAEAAIKIVDEISLRDLRSVATGIGAELASRNEACKSLAADLRDALVRRQKEEQQAWHDEVTTALAGGRVVRALRVSGRPPEPGQRLPEDLVKRLTDSAGQAMGARTTAERWMALLDALCTSSVRRTVVPAAIPDTLTAEMSAIVARSKERVPGLSRVPVAVTVAGEASAIAPESASTSEPEAAEPEAAELEAAELEAVAAEAPAEADKSGNGRNHALVVEELG